MGQSSSNNHPDFEVSPYLRRRPQLRDSDVIDIRNMFDSMVPMDGYVDINDLEMLFTNDFEMKMVRDKCGTRTKLNFDEFFDVISGVILERHKVCRNVDYDEAPKNVHSCFCSLNNDDNRKKRRTA